MSRRCVLPVLLAVAVGLLASSEGRAEEEEAEGWTRVEAVPDWVLEPLVEGGQLRIVDVGQSNLLHLVFHADHLEAAGQGALADLLRPVLGPEAGRVADSVPMPAPARKAYHFQPAPKQRRVVVGGQVYTGFVRWELGLEEVLAAVPADRRADVRAHLTAPPVGADVRWDEVDAPPKWAGSARLVDPVFRVATQEKAAREDVARALSKLRGTSLLRGPMKRRLRPVLGNSLAFAVATEGAARCSLVERAIHVHTRRRLLRAKTQEVTVWQLWEVPLTAILQHVPESHRQAALAALSGPEPGSPYDWVEVAAEPSWVKAPPAWPGHVAVVQVRRSDLPELAKERAAKLGEKDVARVLAAKLAPAAGPDLSRTAAAAGARKRDLAWHAIHEQPPAPGREEVPGSRVFTAWSLWQIPIAPILEALPAEHREAAARALSP